MTRFQRGAILPVMSSVDLRERLRRTCRDRAAAPAVHSLSDGRSVAFSELLDQTETVSRALVGAGIEAGSSVVTLVGNHPIFFPVLAACMEVGAAIVPLGEATDAEARSVVDRSAAAAVITDRPLPLEAVSEVPVGDGIRLLSLGRGKGSISYGESVVLKLTSGSTDVPKAAIAHAAAHRQRRRPHHRSHGYRSRRCEPGLHPAVALLRHRQHCHAAAAPGHGRRSPAVLQPVAVRVRRRIERVDGVSRRSVHVRAASRPEMSSGCRAGCVC